MFKKILLIALLSLNLSSLCFSTPLHDAAERGDLEEVRRLVIEEGVNVDVKEDGSTHIFRHGTTPLHVAAWNGHLAVVEFLVAHNADVNAQNEDDNTPLHVAAGNGHTNVVQLLLHAEADVDVQNEDDKTPLHVATGNGHANVVEAIFNHIEWLENRGRRTKGALRKSSTETSEGASSPTALCHLHSQQNQQSVVDEPEDDEEAEDTNHVQTTVAAQSPVAVEVTPILTLEEGSLAIDFDALLDFQF